MCVYVCLMTVYICFYLLSPRIYLENFFLAEYISVYVLAGNLNTLIKWVPMFACFICLARQINGDKQSCY